MVCDWSYLDVEGKEDSVQLLLLLLLHHVPALVVHDLVGAGGVGDGPADPDGVPVQVSLVLALAHVAQSHLHHGAVLVCSDEPLVGAASAGHPGAASQTEDDGCEDCRLAGSILTSQECELLIGHECEGLEIE